MRYKKLHTPISIRFRRWSRAGYAVFCSLACSVSIGCLASHISDKALIKTVSVTTAASCNAELASQSVENLDKKADLEFAIAQLQELIIEEKTFESTAACSINTFFLLNLTVEMSLSHLNRFLFLL